MRMFFAALVAALLFAAGARADTATGYCYSNYGLSWRTCDSTSPLQSGEVWFSSKADPTQLAAQFPSYAASAASASNALGAQQSYAALRAAGMQLVSTGNASLNGTYALDDATRTNLDGIYSGVKAGDGLPGGGSTFIYQDLAGAPHGFDATSIVAFAKALRDYYYALTVAEGTAAAGGTPAWPAQPVVIP